MQFHPEIHEFSTVPDVVQALESVAALPYPILFDSADARSPLSRFSFLAADPRQIRVLPAGQVERRPFAELRGLDERWRTAAIPDLPPFQGGLAGLLGYELNACFEDLQPPRCDEFQLPLLAVGFYDWVLAWDHQQERAWLISQGIDPPEGRSRAQQARLRLRQVLDLIEGAGARESGGVSEATESIPTGRSAPFPLPEQHSLKSLKPDGILSGFTREGYEQAVERVIEFIRAGDIFQANLSQRLVYRAEEPVLDLYQRLRQRNPAPFAAFMAWDDWAILSASPERFLSVREHEVVTRPIKGTRRRKSLPEADLFTRDELRQSDKDQAENVMIVDLLRNDLSRVCCPGSIQVPELCSIETYETVQHLVSEVRGRLMPDADVWDLLTAAFPGGSITGAPKVRAMQIIQELEPVARGAYCGSLFYHGLDQSFDSSILIRTFTRRGGWLQCSVGGGIVVQSDCREEYEETMHKAAGMLRALEP